MPKYLLTGGGGFIGSNIAERLVKDGDDVRIIDNFSTGRKENIADFLDKIELIEGDICNAADIEKAVDGVDYVLHLAAKPSVPASVADPRGCHEANIDGTFNVLMAAREAGVKRVVYSASSSAYGDTLELPNKETFAPRPLSPYAVAKLVGEYYCKVFTEIFGLECVSLRYFNVFGPKQNPKSQYAAVIPKFILMLLNGEQPTIFGDGEQLRDFTFVENVYIANKLACTAPGAAGKLFNCACGSPISINKLVEVLNDVLGMSIAPVHLDERPGDVKDSAADVT
ncbi:MAG: SDR family oxidoreductase, partial [Planctomycetes bacterium]|nr:SDR family oxidoreductase [Planctomycetota bacterium]